MVKPTIDVNLNASSNNMLITQCSTQTGNYTAINISSDGYYHLSPNYYYKIQNTSSTSTLDLYAYACNLSEMNSGLSQVQYIGFENVKSEAKLLRTYIPNNNSSTNIEVEATNVGNSKLKIHNSGYYIFYLPYNNYSFVNGGVSGTNYKVLYSSSLNGIYTEVANVYFKVTASNSGPPTIEGKTYTADKGAGYYKVIPNNGYGPTITFLYELNYPEVNVIENKGSAIASKGLVSMSTVNDYSIINSTYDLKVSLDKGTGEVYKSSTANGSYSLVSPSNGAYNLTKGYYYKLVSKALSENQTVFNVWASNLSEMPEGLSIVNFVRK